METAMAYLQEQSAATLRKCDRGMEQEGNVYCKKSDITCMKLMVMASREEGPALHPSLREGCWDPTFLCASRFGYRGPLPLFA
jgi:hypothetical protein